MCAPEEGAGTAKNVPAFELGSVFEVILIELCDMTQEIMKMKYHPEIQDVYIKRSRGEILVGEHYER